MDFSVVVADNVDIVTLYLVGFFRVDFVDLRTIDFTVNIAFYIDNRAAGLEPWHDVLANPLAC